MYTHQNNRNERIHEIVSIVKLISLLFSAIIVFNSDFYKTTFNFHYSEHINIFIIFLIFTVLFFIYNIFIYISKKTLNSEHINLNNIFEITFFMIIITGLIYSSGGHLSQYKFLYLFLIIAFTIQYGKKVGFILAILCSIIILFIDLISVPFDTINKFFEIDLVLAGIFILTAWLLGDYVNVEREYGKKLLDLVNIDELTGLYNHRFFQESLEKHIDWSKDTDKPVSLLFMDIDYFKRYNDLYGHLSGDKVLSKVGEIIKSNIGKDDIAARYGGEEFAIILPNTSKGKSLAIGEKIRSVIENTYFEGEENLPNGNLTISVGVSTYPYKAKSKLELLKSADDALFKAKFFNKNKVEFYDSILEELKQDIEEEHIDLISTIKTLISVINAKDRYTYGHTERVVIYCRLLANKLELSDEEKRILKFGAYLHDIGKIEVPKNILNKKMRLSHNEWELIKQHPENGVDIISTVPSLQKIIPLIKYHHEKYDGSGYPEGLMGENIPYLVRILTIADSFDAMTSDRPYQTRKSYEEAMIELERCKNTHFDPLLVDTFIAVIKQNTQYLDTFKFKEIYYTQKI